ncbi:hydroxymethylpyrimidine/phosphomethylpyrimidine kinase [Desulfacinum hydrothermale DSM 13146]|uniref:hydroxymethylpyrimidine kinase n=1 Tax=Desulfacinum hydrothermale DSM 13146 TaxID=1121390 RepID=A0A1W1XV02_9BACT|nr:bifunctional hydroxymethylpyrimidine kinase/phosphomethylpyrimidine kinase [Desulfacinum hydrothermale]SMC27695.1 hydroxymethylpyrimidine/phosphomethylpyrimidine kinase [Desulfacinum hydrothermale DSM 13146]
MAIPRALTIAGSDSGGGAGIQADLKTFSALGVFGMSALTAITAQNTVGVQAVVELEPDFVSTQIRAVVEDIGVDAVKTGMLSSARIIHRVARDVVELGLEKLVVDPVMVAKSGDPLLQPDARDTLIRELLPLSLVVTPNLHEASVLVGFTVQDRRSMEEAAKAIKAFGPTYVLVKGGHLEGDPMDLLYDGKEFVAFQNERFDTPHTHGTGCTFASAVAAGLAKGLSVPEAVAQAKSYITGAIERGLAIGRGHGPVHHFYRLYDLAGWSFE